MIRIFDGVPGSCTSLLACALAVWRHGPPAPLVGNNGRVPAVIRIFDGVPGSGKSYHAAEDILGKLKGGAHVVTNLPLHWDALAKLAATPRIGLFSMTPGVVLEPAQLTILTEEQTKNFFEHLPEGTLDCPTEGYFDELQNLFNSRNWAETQKKHGHVLKFVSHHRHYHTNLTLLTQDRGNIDKQFRVMCAEYWEHIDLNGWSILGLRWPFPQFFRKKFAGTDENHRLFAKFVWKDKRIWTCYDSHNKVQGIELSRKVSRLKLVSAHVSRFHKFTHMIKSWAVIGVCVIAAFVWLWGHFVSGPAAARPGSAPPAALARPGQGVMNAIPSLGAPAASVSVQPTPTPRPPDELRTEKLRYAEGTYYRRTDHAAYSLHRLCPYGYVELVDDDLVTVRRLDGGHVYVILDGASTSGAGFQGSGNLSDHASAAVVAVTTAAAVSSVSPEPSVPTLSSVEGARISAALRQSVSGGSIRPGSSQPVQPQGATPRPFLPAPVGVVH